MRTIGRILPWVLVLAGAFVLGALAAPGLLRSGIWSMRLSHAAFISVGLVLVAAAYWTHAWSAGRLTRRDLPTIVLSLLVIGMLPVPALLLAKQSELNRTVVSLSERLVQMEARAARPARASFGCGPEDPLRKPAVTLREVVSGLRRPVGLTNAGDGSGRLFVIEKGGTIRVVQQGRLLADPFLDVRDLVRSDDADDQITWEQGLLGLAFSPDYSQSGRFFIAYSAQPDGRTVIAEYRVSVDDANRAQPAASRVVLEFPQPGENHNSGHLAFGPDGFLYIGVGDGGLHPDEGHGDDPELTSQRLDTLYGKILRIDVLRGDPYSIPEDNPFVGQPGARPEIYALGLRNPWRFSFDSCDGALFVGDVGRTAWEEVNLVVAAGNYGWPLMEGADCFFRHRRCRRDGLTLPVFAYPHLTKDRAGGASVIGGHVYRGSGFPQLVGYYFFANLMSGHIFSLVHDPASPGRWNVGDLARVDARVSSFGEDEHHELFVVGYVGTVYQLISAD